MPTDNYEDDRTTPRYRLTQALQLADARNTGTIPLRDVQTAFEKVQLKQKTGIENNLLAKLLRALECVSNEQTQMINVSAILQSTYKREDFCKFGIFPKILTKDERKKTTADVVSKMEQEEQKLQKRKDELDLKKKDRIRAKALADKSKTGATKPGAARGLGKNGQDEKDLREEQKEKEEFAKYDKEY
jgi:type IV secretory pathway VirB10-like protein